MKQDGTYTSCLLNTFSIIIILYYIIYWMHYLYVSVSSGSLWRLISTLDRCIIRNWSTWCLIRCTPEPEAPELFSPGKLNDLTVIKTQKVLKSAALWCPHMPFCNFAPLIISEKQKQVSVFVRRRNRISQKRIRSINKLCSVVRHQAADGGSLQRRRSASRRDGTWLSDRLRSEHVTAGAPHDLQRRLRGGRVRTVRPAGILWVVSWHLLIHFYWKPVNKLNF